MYIRQYQWAPWRVYKTFTKLGLMTCTLISCDQKLWEGSHDGGLPDFCVFSSVKTDCSVWKRLIRDGKAEWKANRFVGVSDVFEWLKEKQKYLRFSAMIDKWWNVVLKLRKPLFVLVMPGCSFKRGDIYHFGQKKKGIKNHLLSYILFPFIFIAMVLTNP